MFINRIENPTALQESILSKELLIDKDMTERSDALKKAEADHEILFVPVLIVMETIWVLASVYKISREEILDALNILLLLPILKFEIQPTIRNFVNFSRETKLDLSDMLIAYSAKSSGCESAITFDKKAARFELFELTVFQHEPGEFVNRFEFLKHLDIGRIAGFGFADRFQTDFLEQNLAELLG